MLGICVVYLFTDDESVQLLDLSLAHLRSLTKGPFKIYACGLRLTEQHRSLIADRGVDLIDLDVPKLKTGPEHSYCLDALFDIAVADGCSHVASFDLDSWPVQAGWDQALMAELSPKQPVAAVVRTELNDNFPHGCLILMDSSFWMVGKSSFSVQLRRSVSEEVVQRISRPLETGSGILAQLWADGVGMLELRKSNKWLPHPVMGALYGDLIFHLGAGSRNPIFITDMQQYRIKQDPVRDRFRHAMNRSVRVALVSELASEPDQLYMALSGRDRWPPKLKLTPPNVVTGPVPFADEPTA